MVLILVGGCKARVAGVMRIKESVDCITIFLLLNTLSLASVWLKVVYDWDHVPHCKFISI